jgi:hypothetical protein
MQNNYYLLKFTYEEVKHTMKKIVLIIAALVLISGSAYVAWRLYIRGTDINGITTNFSRNTVYINGYPGKVFGDGFGYLTVDEGKHIHVEYAFESGSIDLLFHHSVEAEMLLVQISEQGSIPDSGDVFGKIRLSGKGALDYEAAPGQYVLYCGGHDAVGSARVTAKGN